MTVRHMFCFYDRIRLAVVQPDMGRYPVAVVKEFHSVTGYSGLYLFTDQVIRDRITVEAVSNAVIRRDSII